MPDAVGIAKKIKKAAIAAQESTKPVEICFGKVKSASPLKILVDQKLLLGEAQLILCKSITDFRTDVTPDWGVMTFDGSNNAINRAVDWAMKIANDDTHEYSQVIRWGPHYDCSSFVITAYEQAGVPVKAQGATYTEDMKSVFLKNGFQDVTKSCNLSTGGGMKKGDVLLNVIHHTALVQIDGGITVEARGKSYGIVANVPYRNYPWDCVLRYMKDGATYTSFPRYSLSESAIKDIATCITGETGGTDVVACRQEASQIANLNEVTKGRLNTEANIINTLHSGWYASASWTRGCTQTAIDAVKFVLIEGNRVLPRYVTEHDTFPLDIINAKNRVDYRRGDTVKNKYGSTYKFYCFFGSDKSGDISGYFQSDYEKYQSDQAWSEGASEDSSTAIMNTNVTVHNGLVVDDEVILIRMQGGQKYIVVDRIG